MSCIAIARDSNRRALYAWMSSSVLLAPLRHVCPKLARANNVPTTRDRCHITPLKRGAALALRLNPSPGSRTTQRRGTLSP